MDRRTFLTAAGTGAAALSLGAVTAPAAVAAPTDPRLLKTWFRDTYRSIEAMTTDFGLVTDKIDLSGIDANSTAGANDAFTFVGSAAFTSVAGQLRAHQSGATWIVEGDTNGDGTADLTIEVTSDHALTSADLFL